MGVRRTRARRTHRRRPERHAGSVPQSSEPRPESRPVPEPPAPAQGRHRGGRRSAASTREDPVGEVHVRRELGERRARERVARTRPGAQRRCELPASGRGRGEGPASRVSGDLAFSARRAGGAPACRPRGARGRRSGGDDGPGGDPRDRDRRPRRVRASRSGARGCSPSAWCACSKTPRSSTTSPAPRERRTWPVSRRFMPTKRSAAGSPASLERW